MKFARGLSIRAAETIAAEMGFNRCSTVLIPIDDNSVKVTATFTDYCSGRIWVEDVIVSKWYKARGGSGLKKHADDRFQDIVVKAAKSKAIREAILRTIPAPVKMSYWAMCEKTLDGLLDDATEEKMVSSFANKGVDLGDLETLLGGVPRKMGWTKKHRQQLVEAWNALESGETTVPQLTGQHPKSENDAPVTANMATIQLTDALEVPQGGSEPTPERPKRVPPPLADVFVAPEPASQSPVTEEGGSPIWVTAICDKIRKYRKAHTLKAYMDEVLNDESIGMSDRSIVKKCGDEALAALSAAV
jgi:hypothetical protein